MSAKLMNRDACGANAIGQCAVACSAAPEINYNLRKHLVALGRDQCREPVLRTTGVEARNYVQNGWRILLHLVGR